ncbi:RNA polymerase sigma factor [Neobacillus sp. DY30]|uniref:RNA polymerase sigma factor n=1 Tax=Neobacillus sp. DY30 TaxID=3047871 RepID=UPI0024BF9C5D|nr:RNA polymerase sigma factor [Neobacillus sp. DY30]WHY01668.1 RNA polymerase sigma factor [Neobacillus sp. DY30]
MRDRLTDSFESMVKEHGKAIFNYIFSLVRQKELTEDLYQEVLISAYMAFHTVKEPSRLRGWLFTIARNKCRDYWRKENKTKQFWKEEVYSYSAAAEAPPLPEEEVLHKDSAAKMTESVKALPEIYQSAIFLYYYKDLTLNEISKRTNIPISTVKTRMKRGKEHLKPKLKSFA